MKAVGYIQSLPISNPKSLIDIELSQPTASGHDLLVQVMSIAVNPVDYKIRQNVAAENDEYKVLGWDAVGEVVAIGESVSHFKPGDKVFYAGDLNRQGSNAEYQLVDERIVGHKPKSLSDGEAAALPLTAITAWELLFERLLIKQQHPEIKKKSNDIILIVGAAGGVGSILVQLASALTGATVIATASRDSSAKWVKKLGADYVIDHSKSLVEQIEQLAIGQVTHVASLTHTDSYLDSFVELLAPMGKIALIDDPKSLDISKLKFKSLSLHWEFMFTRSMFKTTDINEQHRLLNKIADLIDQGYIQTTVGKNLGTINAKNLRAAHKILESGQSIGKIVLEGF
ncbi:MULTISPECIES: zinc-binding alcohol dehydrogenase family protein [unclassified Colwellia]|jgi:zinc-binding alcohol dehydrogenase family protein|uniref:zinc-binding alcohol dehydrogenase family protein n=1 Tax=unclassified Colwellia TaxID=196834 RepID=UPI0015F37ECE|nr:MULTISPECIES: zinc-binding alcohol dehydrogenase family protein [unclassified Colwellia]MBA6337031.1 zinc-binding alcohol dehydrogenase family protein [Colwellia sp. BRX8-7]MBA6353651.1 zinc-binding alcohol dehydrogenase family protein [Colwellia sp. BRX9-1]MBA6356399.1 zinc-binding alcohol dehydrogenase family protein [Colwellia sp. BRX8-3]MBA6360184.1 zinc-binding alcohol dehydrogenase family protein [Colwellia sp. BRX8-6]MBA6368588.1 zinc-binding alcohol dehydrogenase family protein [Col